MTMYHHKSPTSIAMHQYRYITQNPAMSSSNVPDLTITEVRPPFLSRRFWVVPDVDQAPRPSTGTVRVAHAAIQASKQHR